MRVDKISLLGIIYTVRMNSLDILYEELDFKNGSLYSAMDTPSLCPHGIDWVEKGEWFAAAKRASAEKIFFVQNNPVVVFAECGSGPEEKIKAFNRAWCLAHPRLLFLASPGEISVYDLAQKPVDEKKKEDWKKLKPLDILNNLNEVSHRLQKYHRDNVESGRVFGDKRFGDLKNRADNSLIRDLKTVRRELIHAGLSDDDVRFAHALIGRSIFIRYLEDRQILTEDYLFNIARKDAAWTDLLLNPTDRDGLDFSSHKTYYPRILANKAFSYELFRSLSKDFNGDMFPDVEKEEQIVTQEEHLTLIQDLLYGDVGVQKKLFFYSYRFDIIPLDLISSIYEAFYHTSTDTNKKKQREDGAYYTPPVLVEFALSRILTPEVLDKAPRVLDPACGSGIFLVEAFRRIARYEWYKNKQPLTFEILKGILKEQIAGIEVNEEAAGITAFSLYLSMLHYLDPPSIDRHIKAGNKLPNLIATECQSSNHFHSILPANAFDTEFINSNPVWKERFGAECADIVIGNPPWGAPGKKADDKTKKRHQKMIQWCKSNNKPIGDKELSQAFLWIALNLLKSNGKSVMLISAGVLLKHHEKSQKFRRKWLDSIRLQEVFNFSHVRTVFFKGAISPFVVVLFKKEKQGDSPVHYWSAKKNVASKNNQTIFFSKNDLNILHDLDLADNRTWKLFMWGRHKDYEFLNYLKNSPEAKRLKDVTRFSCVGFQMSPPRKHTETWLLKLDKIKKGTLSRYNRLDNVKDFEKIPSKIYLHGREDSYIGQRIIVAEVPRQKGNTAGRIIARLETEPYANNHSLHILKLSKDSEWEYCVSIGILWSSLSRYYLFLTTHYWGVWRDKVLVEERLQLPVIFERTNPATEKIISIVTKLRNYHPRKRDIFHPDGIPVEDIDEQRKQWETELDDAVFELFGLNEEEKDLIRDLCDVTLPFYYAPLESRGSMPAVEKNDYTWIEKYVNTFCRRWDGYLGDDEEMRAEVHIGLHGNMVAVEFFPSDKGDSWDLIPKNDNWGYILEEIGKTLPQPIGASQIIMDGLVHVVSDSGIIVIKRNEKRFWTRSLAREDADSGLCKRIAEAIPDEGTHT